MLYEKSADLKKKTTQRHTTKTKPPYKSEYNVTEWPNEYIYIIILI